MMTVYKLQPVAGEGVVMMVYNAYSIVSANEVACLLLLDPVSVSPVNLLKRQQQTLLSESLLTCTQSGPRLETPKGTHSSHLHKQDLPRWV